MRDDASPASGRSRWAASANLPVAQAPPQKTKQAITNASNDFRRIPKLRQVAPRPDSNVPKISSRDLKNPRSFYIRFAKFTLPLHSPLLHPRKGRSNVYIYQWVSTSTVALDLASNL
jgi:hypothetical protein